MLEGYSDIIVAHNRVSVTRDWLTRTVAGRALLIGIVIKSATLTLGAFGVPGSGIPGLLDTIGGIAIFAGALVLAYRLVAMASRGLLWRVRRKLTLSYVFIGFVPALLIIGFFLLAGLLLFFNISSYLMQSRIRDLAEEAQFLAQATTLELARATGGGAMADILDGRYADASLRHPDVSYVIVPTDSACGADNASPQAAVDAPVQAGAWLHVSPPSSLPDWIGCAGYAGLVASAAGAGPVEPDGAHADRTSLAVRAVAPSQSAGRYAVIVDIPLTAAVARQLRDDTGVELDTNSAPSNAAASSSRAGSGGLLDLPLEWVVFLDYVDWSTGRPGTGTLATRASLGSIYNRISATPVAPLGNFSFGQVLLILLAVVAGLFLVIQIVALGMGLALARSITGAVHELFIGTERVREGDFAHRIPIRARDQLGQLADSFNSMTASIADLLQQKAEKERLEQELRIAREIQMSLLPQGPVRMPGLALAAHCAPAREVGGDYYDVIPLDGAAVGVLIADVAGKGTSAALYMAELKGVVLSLSRLHRSPRQLLIDTNRIVSAHLSPRSFITATYAVADVEARTLTLARAGHSPLLFLPGAGGPERRLQVLAPDGMVLGLQIDNGDMFNRILEEVTVPLGAGDLFMLYTDGIVEATNAAGDYFGEGRLGTLLEANADLSCDELRDRVLREVRSFVGDEPQQDDMTMVLMRVEG